MHASGVGRRLNFRQMVLRFVPVGAHQVVKLLPGAAIYYGTSFLHNGVSNAETKGMTVVEELMCGLVLVVSPLDGTRSCSTQSEIQTKIATRVRANNRLTSEESEAALKLRVFL